MSIIKHLQQHKLLLDTHVWLWAMIGDLGLSKSFLQAFERILHHPGILISPLSIWEIGMLVDKKRIEIEMDVMDWINQALDISGMHLCPISPRIAIQSTRLPGKFHGDPVDRLLVATAHEENAVLVTCDHKILEYSKDNFIDTYNPSK